MTSVADPMPFQEDHSVSSPFAHSVMTKDNPPNESSTNDQTNIMPPAMVPKTQYSSRRKISMQPPTNILQGSYTPSELSMMKMLDKAFLWVDAYNASNHHSNNQDVLENEHGVDMEQIEKMMNTYSITELRQKLLLVQQQLYTHHDLMDKHEECNAKITQVKQEMQNILVEKKKIETCNKRLRLRSRQHKVDMSRMEKQLADMVTDLASTKLQLAQARTQQDHSDALLRSISNQKDALLKAICDDEKDVEKSHCSSSVWRSSFSFKVQRARDEDETMTRRHSWWPLVQNQRLSTSSISVLTEESCEFVD
mmetsp:Transcript_43200/g.65252  ORF Transcript_43200/g.65252 Transcript_43200/m.65252 type:complete len:309 (+) Transcript_43200:227-1153(+)